MEAEADRHRFPDVRSNQVPQICQAKVPGLWGGPEGRELISIQLPGLSAIRREF